MAKSVRRRPVARSLRVVVQRAAEHIGPFPQRTSSADRIVADPHTAKAGSCSVAVAWTAGVPCHPQRGNMVEGGGSLSREAGVADILVVDDDADILDSLAELLEAAGYRVRTSANGLEAVEAIERERPALILLD